MTSLASVNSGWQKVYRERGLQDRVALPDFGNTLDGHDENYAYPAIDAMFAYAYAICHVKDSIGTAQGKVVGVDLARTFAILRHHSYRGYCSIEYDAPGGPYRVTVSLIDTTVTYLS
jgi:hypothetical protein